MSTTDMNAQYADACREFADAWADDYITDALSWAGLAQLALWDGIKDEIAAAKVAYPELEWPLPGCPEADDASGGWNGWYGGYAGTGA